MCMEEQKDLHRRILVNLGIALAGILLLVFVVPPLIRLLMPLIVAWIVAMIANPIIRFLEKRCGDNPNAGNVPRNARI